MIAVASLVLGSCLVTPVSAEPTYIGSSYMVMGINQTHLVHQEWKNHPSELLRKRDIRKPRRDKPHCSRVFRTQGP